MKKIYLLLVPMLPCPSVKGGAIETLLTNIAKEHEKNKNDIDLNIISIYDKKAYVESQKYKKTNFIFLKYSFIDKVFFNVKKLFKKILKIDNLLSYYYSKALKIIPKDADLIIAEGGNNEMLIPFSKKYGRNRIVLHLHYELHSNEMLNKIYGNLISVSEFIEKRYDANDNVTSVVLKNGINIENFSQIISIEERNSLRKKYNIKEDDFVILFCGRTIPEKGIDKLIQAVKIIKNENVKLLIAGSQNFGEDSENIFENKLKNEIEDCKNRIIFAGFIHNDEIYKIYKSADILCIPSVWDDPAPLVAIEGMVSGLPIVATKSGGMIEYIDKECAIIIDKDENIVENLKNAILELYESEGKRKKMSNHGISISKQYSSENYYNDFINIVKEMN